jgi:DNA polymerase III epsilon subunit-like protein
LQFLYFNFNLELGLGDTAQIVQIAIFHPESEAKFCMLVNPEGARMTASASRVTGITDTTLQTFNPDPWRVVAQEVFTWISGFRYQTNRLFCHNVGFDEGRISYMCKRDNLVIPSSWKFSCTLQFLKQLYPGIKHTLQALATHLNVQVQQSHRALDDCCLLWKVLSAAISDCFDAEGPVNVLMSWARTKHLPPKTTGNRAGRNDVVTSSSTNPRALDYEDDHSDPNIPSYPTPLSNGESASFVSPPVVPVM